jgi:hypothetical protein
VRATQVTGDEPSEHGDTALADDDVEGARGLWGDIERDACDAERIDHVRKRTAAVREAGTAGARPRGGAPR